MKRRRNALVFLLAVIAAAAGGWALGQQVTSPAEIAARTEAPIPAPILVPTELRALSTDVVTRGTARFGSPVDVSLPQSLLKGARAVLTTLPEVGDEVAEGEVLLRSSGRPVIVLAGDQPMFRDLGPGMVGGDVDQLAAALGRLGLLTGDDTGGYGPAMAAAVEALYGSVGAAPAVATDEQLVELLDPSAAVFAGSAPAGGTLVPADEILFLPSLPARVAELESQLGAPIEGPVLTLTDANVAIDGSLPIEQAGLVQPGMEVLIDEPDLGIDAVGVVSRVAAGPGTDGLDGFHVYFEVVVGEAPANLVNASVRLTIPIETTADEVLAVPVAALFLAPDGSSMVQVERNGRLESVGVHPGLSAQGMVEVVPIDGGLADGAMVLVGFEDPAVGS